jgi:hypothetical protein
MQKSQTTLLFLVQKAFRIVVDDESSL